MLKRMIALAVAGVLGNFGGFVLPNGTVPLSKRKDGPGRKRRPGRHSDIRMAAAEAKRQRKAARRAQDAR